MEVRLSNPALERYIAAEVAVGRFPSPDAAARSAIASAIALMMRESDEALDDDTIQAIARAEAQFGRGEGESFSVFAADFRRRF